MKVEDLLAELREVIDEAKSIPLMSGKMLVNADQVKEILDDIEDTLPQEVRQAKAIVADRATILANAKKEADNIIRVADERQKALINQNEVIKQAQVEANDIINEAKIKSREIRKASNDYVEELMRQADEFMTAQTNEIKKTRQNLKSAQRTKAK